MGVFALPSLGADMEDAVLVEFTVAPGDPVKRGDVVAVVETQKGAIEVECFEEGTVAALQAEVGERLPVGAPLLRLAARGEAVEPEPAVPSEPAAVPPETRPAQAPDTALPADTAAPPDPRAAAAPAGPPPQARRPAAPAAPPRTPAPPSSGKAAGVVPASPAARARASEAGVDLAAVTGSGPGGAVLLGDVEAAVASDAPPPGKAAPVSGTPDTGVPESGGTQTGVPEAPAPAAQPGGKPGLDPAALRAAVARMMARSKREIPHYYLAQTIDLQPAADWLAARNASLPPEDRLLMGALIARATALAAAEAPDMNGTFENDAFAPADTVNLGVIVALRGGGLIAPAVLDAQRLDLGGMMDAMRDLVARSRTGRLKNSEMTAGTLTLTSMGEGGSEAVTGVIYPPQVAIVGAGAPVIRPWVEEGAVVPRLTLTLTLAADHRVSDGRRGARFLAEIARLLQEPDRL